MSRPQINVVKDDDLDAAIDYIRRSSVDVPIPTISDAVRASIFHYEKALRSGAKKKGKG